MTWYRAVVSDVLLSLSDVAYWSGVRTRMLCGLVSAHACHVVWCPHTHVMWRLGWTTIEDYLALMTTLTLALRITLTLALVVPTPPLQAERVVAELRALLKAASPTLYPTCITAHTHGPGLGPGDMAQEIRCKSNFGSSTGSPRAVPFFVVTLPAWFIFLKASNPSSWGTNSLNH